MPNSINPDSIVEESEMSFAALLEESFKRRMPEQGDVVTGTILAVDQQGLLVDVGLKKDGVVHKNDLERLGTHAEFQIGQEIPVVITRMEDMNGNVVVSIAQAIQAEDWEKADKLMTADEVYEGGVVEANRGGLIVTFGNLRGFVPASHVINVPRGVSEEERQRYMESLVGKPVTVKVIEVNRKRRRLVFSQREAIREQRTLVKEQLMDELKEGEVREGVVSGLRDFGAFVDLGGADGLIHISELAWHRVQHPREVVAVGDRVKVYVMHLDQNDKRIGLSLKRLQQNPWAQIDEMYHIGQLVLGNVSRVAQYGAFIRLEPGIEALLHATQIAEPPPADVTQLIEPGRNLLLRIISIESDRQRLGLSLKDVNDAERQIWADEHGYDALDLKVTLFGDIEGAIEETEVEEEEGIQETGTSTDNPVESPIESAVS